MAVLLGKISDNEAEVIMPEVADEVGTVFQPDLTTVCGWIELLRLSQGKGRKIQS